MSTKLTKTEVKNVEADDYSSFGKPIVKDMSDPADICLPGAFLDKYQLVQLDRCPLLMSQRCSENFDEKCDLYFQSLKDINDIRDFISQTLKKKFCKLADDSSCKMMCQKFDPIAEESVDICQPVGDEVLEDKHLYIDTGLSEAVSISPYYMSRCKLQCDSKASDVKEDDGLIKKALDAKVGSDVLTVMCKNTETEEIKNPDMKYFCDSLKKKEDSEKEKKTEKFGQQIKQEFNEFRMRHFVILSVVIILLLYVVYSLYRRNKK